MRAVQISEKYQKERVQPCIPQRWWPFCTVRDDTVLRIKLNDEISNRILSQRTVPWLWSWYDPPYYIKRCKT